MAKRGPKAQDIPVVITVRRVPLPDREAEDRWFEGMRILLDGQDDARRDEPAASEPVEATH